jgi:hypothetical protein
MEIQMIERSRVSRAAVEANRAFKPIAPETTEYAKTQKAFHDNRERLKAERQAREAAAGPARFPTEKPGRNASG